MNHSFSPVRFVGNLSKDVENLYDNDYPFYDYENIKSTCNILDNLNDKIDSATKGRLLSDAEQLEKIKNIAPIKDFNNNLLSEISNFKSFSKIH